MVRREEVRDRGIERLPPVRGKKAGPVIEERRSGQAGDLQQNRPRALRAWTFTAPCPRILYFSCRLLTGQWDTPNRLAVAVSARHFSNHATAVSRWTSCNELCECKIAPRKSELNSQIQLPGNSSTCFPGSSLYCPNRRSLNAVVERNVPVRTTVLRRVISVGQPFLVPAAIVTHASRARR